MNKFPLKTSSQETHDIIIHMKRLNFGLSENILQNVLKDIPDEKIEITPSLTTDNDKINTENQYLRKDEFS